MVKPKKHLGQHFLTDQSVAKKIADALTVTDTLCLVEIGPGTGVLTQYLVGRPYNFYVVEIDEESVGYLQKHYSEEDFNILNDDFLKLDLADVFESQFNVIGNFPYNISSQLFFKFLDYVALIPEVVCMLQKEVAERIASGPGSKVYGILSVLMQAHYDIEYLFTVSEEKFNPPPKVKSGVIRLVRRQDWELPCSPKLFKQIVKAAFNNRRKTLRNALKSFNLPIEMVSEEVFSKRAEQLHYLDFVKLTQAIEQL